jgi:hypothetical protein
MYQISTNYCLNRLRDRKGHAQKQVDRREAIVGDGYAPAHDGDGLDADTTNDGNDVIGVRIRTQIRSDRSDPAVNGGNPVDRWYEWRVAPRNLLYEKNKM